MHNTKLSCYYHKASSNSEILNSIKYFLHNIENNNSTEKIGEYSFYIRDYDNTNEKFICFTLTKVDVEEIPELDNIQTQKRKLIEKDEDEGLAKDAQFLYHYESNILIHRKGKGGPNMKDLQSFLAVKINLKPKDVGFNLILEKDVMKKIETFEIFEEFNFSVALPKQLTLFKSEDDDINKTISLLESLDGNSMTFSIKGKKLKKNIILDLIKSLRIKNNNSNIELRSLSIHGDQEILDLVKGSLGYSASLKASGDKIENKEVYKFLISAYNKNKNYLEVYKNE